MAEGKPGRRIGRSPQSRTPEELWHELQSRGRVSLESVNAGARLAVVVGVVTASVLALLGAVALVVGIPLVSIGLFGFAAGGAFIAAIAHAKGRSARGVPWLIDRHGVTINGVGPVPWTDLAPTTWRMEPSLHDEGRTRTLVMPLTELGIRRAAALPPEAKMALDPGNRRTLLGGQQPPSIIRLTAMKEIPEESFARFLDGARDLARRGML